MDIFTAGIEWFPQDHAAELFAVKGVLALLGTLMLLWHMSTAWNETMSPGQRMRYLALLVYAVVATGSSVEQIQQDALVDYRHLGALTAAVVLVVAMGVSIAEHRRLVKK